MSPLNQLLVHVLDSPFRTVLATLATVLATTFLYTKWQRRRLPPGPRGLPLVGYLPFLDRRAPQITLLELSKTYGPVYTVQLGTADNVILNGWDAIKEALGQDAATGRPKENSFTALVPITTMGNEHGAIWREQKRFALKTFRDLGFGRDKMESKILDEISCLIKVIDAEEQLVIRESLAPSVSNNVSALVFGRRFDYDDETRLMLNRILSPKDRNPFLVMLMIVFPNIPKLFKLLAYFEIIGTKAALQRSQEMVKFVGKQIDDHEKTLDKDNIRDYIDGFLVEMEERHKVDPATSFTKDMLSGNVRGFFAAGSDTVRTTLEWLFTSLAAYPNVQEKVLAEIDSVIGRTRQPSWSDRAHMPYTQAVLQEVQRWKTVVPLNLPRWSLEDMVVQGVRIPKDVQLLANFWSVHHDPKLFPEPEQFKPERFVDSKGAFVKCEEFLAFSYGKRACPGESLAISELFLYAACLVQRYEVSMADGTEADFTEAVGITAQPLVAAKLRFKVRQ